MADLATLLSAGSLQVCIHCTHYCVGPVKLCILLFQRIRDGEMVSCPIVLQVLGSRSIPRGPNGESKYSYWLLMSDGISKNPFVMVMKNLDARLEGTEFNNFSIIRILGYERDRWGWYWKLSTCVSCDILITGTTSLLETYRSYIVVLKSSIKLASPQLLLNHILIWRKPTMKRRRHLLSLRLPLTPTSTSKNLLWFPSLRWRVKAGLLRLELLTKQR